MYNDSVVTTRWGRVRGRTTAGGVRVFRGIRHGRDTALDRFLPPCAPAPWSDVANAFEFGPTAPQHDPESATHRADNPLPRKIGLTDNLPESEDCLFLNVWAPPARDEPPAPVMVWVHSDAFAVNSGSSPSIDGTHLAESGGVVVVSFNHRLNVLGYCHLTDDEHSPFVAAGNVGMLDIVAALEWVRDNVTVFGQSGGAMKIATLLGMPAAGGLFHKAIMQSGDITRARSASEAMEATEDLCHELGLDAVDPSALQAADLRSLMRAYH